MEFNRIKNSSPVGDLIAALAGVRNLWLETGRKTIIYQRIGMIGTNQIGAENAYQNEDGEDICFSDETFEMVKPLLMAQEYIEDLIVFDGQQVDIDLDEMRLSKFVNQPFGSINRYPSYIAPQMAPNLSEKYIYAPKPFQSNVISINFTGRYRNRFIHYNFLRPYQDRLMFIGLPKEHGDFCKEWNLSIPLFKSIDFCDIAQLINTSKFFMGCQSACFQISEGLKIPRILETYHLMPNVIPIGEHAYDFYNQNALEYYFQKLLCL